MIKDFLKRHPKLEKLIIKIKRVFVPEQSFVDSTTYWENRYKRRGDSGPGSYNKLAEYKSSVVNEIIKKEKIDSIIDWGCGDGNIAKFYKVDKWGSVSAFFDEKLTKNAIRLVSETCQR